jgi:hypothetical protein
VDDRAVVHSAWSAAPLKKLAVTLLIKRSDLMQLASSDGGSLFNDDFQQLRLYSDERNGGKWMINSKGCGRKRPRTNLMYYPGNCLEGLIKPRINCQDNKFMGSDMNTGPPEYEAGVWTTRPRHSVTLYGTATSLPWWQDHATQTQVILKTGYASVK